MTTLYRPVLIESVEQAEALPVGTLAREGANVIIKSFDGRWWWAGLDGVVQPQAEAAVAWTALVPVEAEEETTRAEPFADGTIHVGPQHWRDEPSRRLVTPWEEA